MLSPPVAAPKNGCPPCDDRQGGSLVLASGIAEQQKDLSSAINFPVFPRALGLAAVIESDQLDFPAVDAALAVDELE